jgi:predicted RNA-binding Zn ribbon-like protein
MGAYSTQRADLVQDLINTYDLYLDEPEHLREPHDLQSFLETRGLSAASPITQTDLNEVRELRQQLRLAWDADTTSDMLSLLNPLVASTPVTLQFEEDAEQHVHLRVEEQPDTPLVQHLAVECALDIIDVLQQHGFERMRACAADPCQDVFIDTSRNNSRRFCSERCANRYNISVFRERQKETKRGKA